MTPSPAQLQELLDRQLIFSCLLRYTRGVDRLDRELLLSAYHPDAIADYGVFVGGREALADWVFAYHGGNQRTTQHILSNHWCEIAGDVAHCETYYTYYSVDREGTDSVAFGRYIDRLERRNGRWALAARVCLTESMSDLLEPAEDPAFAAALRSSGRSSRDRSDPSYLRPLTTRRPRT